MWSGMINWIKDTSVQMRRTTRENVIRSIKRVKELQISGFTRNNFSHFPKT